MPVSGEVQCRFLVKFNPGFWMKEMSKVSKWALNPGAVGVKAFPWG